MTQIVPSAETVLGPDNWSVVLWDLDGTITDSAEEITARITKALRLAGCEVPPRSVLLKLIGPPLYEGYREVLGLTHDQAMHVLDGQRNIAELEGLGQRSALYRGVAPLLAELHAAGMPMAVASSKGEHQVEHVTDHFKLAHFFEVRVGSIEAIGRMSKADVIAEAMRQLDALGIDTSRPIMVGDRVHDIEGAAAHGIPAVVVDWGYHNGESSDGAIARADTAEELREFLFGPAHSVVRA